MEDRKKYLTNEEIAKLFQFLNGWTEDGYSKVTISYQNFIAENTEDLLSVPINSTEKAAVLFSYDKANPQWISVDLIFRSHQEPELRLLWGNLQRFKKSLAEEPDKTPVFILNIMQNETVTYGATKKDCDILYVDAVNPLSFSLSNETPAGAGPNMIRLLFACPMVEFHSASEEEFTEELDGTLREMDAERFISEPQATSAFDEVL